MTIYGLYDLEDNYIYSGNIHEMAKFIEQPEASIYSNITRRKRVRYNNSYKYKLIKLFKE